MYTKTDKERTLNPNELKTTLMIRDRFSLFSRIPKKIVMTEIGGIKSGTVMQYLIEADYENFYNILSIQPQWMFDESSANNIDGKVINCSPLEFALYILDETAWELCYLICLKYPRYLQPFFNTVEKSSENHIDLSAFFKTYDIYFTNFDLYKQNLIVLEELRKSWLAVGKAQKEQLPRHMLRVMCLLHYNLFPANHDIILISLSTDKPVNKETLVQLVKVNHYPVFIKNDNSYMLCTYNYISDSWEFYALSKSPFKQTEFPKQFNLPVLRPRETDLSNLKFAGDDYLNWHKGPSMEIEKLLFFQDIVIDKNGSFEKLIPLSPDSRLGEEFSLARGNSVLCYAVENPTGNHGFLKGKAFDDCESLKQLYSNKIHAKESFMNKMEINGKLEPIGEREQEYIFTL